MFSIINLSWFVPFQGSSFKVGSCQTRTIALWNSAHETMTKNFSDDVVLIMHSEQVVELPKICTQYNYRKRKKCKNKIN